MNVNSLQRCKPLLGTFVEVSLQGKCSEQALLDYSECAFDEIARIHHLFSFHESGSELSKINTKLLTQPNTKIEIGKELVDILSLAQSLFVHSNGQYDLTIASSLVLDGQLPNHLNLNNQTYGKFSDINIGKNTISSSKPLCLDLGGIAKGYAVDQAVNKLPQELDISINAGGDLYQNNWQGKQVQVKFGKRSSATRNTLMRHQALATSGNYYRYGKSAIIEPFSQKQKKIHGCISVFASSVMLADALTKLVLLMPRQECKSILELYQVHAFKINRFGLIKTIK